MFRQSHADVTVRFLVTNQMLIVKQVVAPVREPRFVDVATMDVALRRPSTIHAALMALNLQDANVVRIANVVRQNSRLSQLPLR